MRVGLWDVYGGSMPSGWTRWLLEQFEFPFEVVYQKGLDAGNLASRFDVLIFVDGAFPARETAPARSRRRTAVPPEYRDRLGAVSDARTVPELRRFVEAGGTLIAIGSSTSLGRDLGLPSQSALVERDERRRDRLLSADKFFVPGSILEARVDRSHPLAYGIGERVNVFFDHSEAFRLGPEAAREGREGRRLVRRPGSSQERLGVGSAVSRSRPSRSSTRPSGRDVSSCSGRRSPGGLSRTGRSSSCSTESTLAPGSQASGSRERERGSEI